MCLNTNHDRGSMGLLKMYKLFAESEAPHLKGRALDRGGDVLARAGWSDRLGYIMNINEMK